MRGLRTPRHVRLTEPLVRDGGRLRPASWDEALDRGGRRLRARTTATRSACSAARRRRTR